MPITEPPFLITYPNLGRFAQYALNWLFTSHGTSISPLPLHSGQGCFFIVAIPPPPTSNGTRIVPLPTHLAQRMYRFPSRTVTSRFISFFPPDIPSHSVFPCEHL